MTVTWRARLQAWARLSPAEFWRTAEAAVLLTAAAAAVRLLPFRWYAPVLGRRVAAPAPADGSGAASRDAVAGVVDREEVARAVGRGLRRAGRRLPWRSTCLVHALAGQVMLRRRRCPGVVFVGAARRDGERFDYHAWLLAGAVWVSGRLEAPDYTVVATFR